MALVDLLVPLFLGLREGIEAILIVVILLLYLKNTKQELYNKYVYFGIILAILVSILFSFIFTAFLGGFTGILEQIFEGVTFIVSGFFIITLILWMSKEGPKMKAHLEKKAEQSIQKEKLTSITILTFIIIIREGIELVLILSGTASVGSLDPFQVIIGSLIGISIAIGIGFLTFFGFKSINLSIFFKITNIILILFAAGLITYGLHELIEAGVVNPIIDEVWNLKQILPESFPDGNITTPGWLEVIGSFLRALFGYNANPSLLEIIVYPSLLTSLAYISLKLWKKNNKNLNIK